MRLPSLMDDMAEPEEEEYRVQVVRYLDLVFHECLDEEVEKLSERRGSQSIR